MAYPEYLIQRVIELSPGRSAGEILRELKKEFKDDDLPNERTITRWRKAPPVIHVGEGRGPIPSSLAENWKGHNERLAGVAETLLDNDLKRVMEWVTQTGEVEYQLFDESETHLVQSLTVDDLAYAFEDNITLAYQDYTEWFFRTCFLPHLYAEWSDELTDKGFYVIAREQPYQLIETLRLLAERKTFKGTCPVCEDW